MNVYTSSLCCSRSSRQMVKPFMAYFQNNIIIQRYSNNGGEESTNNKPIEHEERLPRAPSTAEQFERVAQEKARQTAEDAIEEATTGDSSQFESIKEPVGKGISHKTEDV